MCIKLSEIKRIVGFLCVHETRAKLKENFISALKDTYSLSVLPWQKKPSLLFFALYYCWKFDKLLLGVRLELKNELRFIFKLALTRFSSNVKLDPHFPPLVSPVAILPNSWLGLYYLPIIGQFTFAVVPHLLYYCLDLYDGKATMLEILKL